MMAHAQDADFEAEVEKAMAKLRQEMGGMPTWEASAGASRAVSNLDPAAILPEPSVMDMASRYSPLHLAARDSFSAPESLRQEQRDMPAFGRRASKPEMYQAPQPNYQNITTTDPFLPEPRHSIAVGMGRRGTRGGDFGDAIPNAYPIGMRGRMQSREYDNSAPAWKRELDDEAPLPRQAEGNDGKTNKKAAYAAELQQQIEEKNARKKLEKLADERSPGGAQVQSAARSPPGSPQLERMAMPANQGADAITKAIQSGHTFSRYRHASADEHAKILEKYRLQDEVAAQLQVQVEAKRRQDKEEAARLSAWEAAEEQRVHRELAGMILGGCLLHLHITSCRHELLAELDRRRASEAERPIRNTSSAPNDRSTEAVYSPPATMPSTAVPEPEEASNASGLSAAMKRKLRHQQLLNMAKGRGTTVQESAPASQVSPPRQSFPPPAPRIIDQRAAPDRVGPTPPEKQLAYESDDSLSEFTRVHQREQTIRRPVSSAPASRSEFARLSSQALSSNQTQDPAFSPEEVAMLRQMQAVMTMMNRPPPPPQAPWAPAHYPGHPQLGYWPWTPPVPMPVYVAPTFGPTPAYAPEPFTRPQPSHLVQTGRQLAAAQWSDAGLSGAPTAHRPEYSSPYLIPTATYAPTNGYRDLQSGADPMQFVGRGRPMTAPLAEPHSESFFGTFAPERSLWASSSLVKDETASPVRESVPLVEQSLNSSTMFVMMENASSVARLPLVPENEDDDLLPLRQQTSMGPHDRLLREMDGDTGTFSPSSGMSTQPSGMSTQPHVPQLAAAHYSAQMPSAHGLVRPSEHSSRSVHPLESNTFPAPSLDVLDAREDLGHDSSRMGQGTQALPSSGSADAHAAASASQSDMFGKLHSSPGMQQQDPISELFSIPSPASRKSQRGEVGSLVETRPVRPTTGRVESSLATATATPVDVLTASNITLTQASDDNVQSATSHAQASFFTVSNQQQSAAADKSVPNTALAGEQPSAPVMLTPVHERPPGPMVAASSSNASTENHDEAANAAHLISEAEIQAALQAALNPTAGADEYGDDDFENEDHPPAMLPSAAPQRQAMADGPAAVVAEAATSRASAAALSWGMSEDEVALHKRRLLAFYTVHAPAKAHAENVDAAWQLFGPKVWDELERKYKNKTSGFRPSPVM